MSPNSQMVRGTLVVISSVHWHATWQRHHDVAARLARAGWKVLFVEPLPKRWPRLDELGRVWGRIRGARASSGYCRQSEVEGVELLSPVLLPDVGPLSRRINSWFFVGRLARELRAAGEASRPLVVWNFLPLNASINLQERLEADLCLYDCVTDWAEDPYAGQSVLFERRLLERAAVVLADSVLLTEKMSQLHGNVEQVLPAADYESFAPTRDHRGVRRNEQPVCSYFGSVGPDVDLDVLRRVSEVGRLRLIGPVRVDLGDLADHAELIGPVPREELPALLADADVLLLPYRQTGHTAGVIPAKTFECLATGKPMVACGLPSLREYGDVIYLCDSGDQVVEAISRAGSEVPERRERRLAVARANTWAVRIEQIESILARELVGQRAVGSP